jgi:23S rRNA (guanosine2251-2'-O)-methyltransferase
MNQQKKQNIVYGLHTVRSVLKYQPKRAKKLFIARNTLAKDLVSQSQSIGIPHELSERDYLEQKFNVGKEAQGVVLLCSPFSYVPLNEMLADTKRILVLDSWQDPVNLGRAARAAVCFGADGIVICKDRSAHITPLAEKAAVGALSQIKVSMVVNWASALKKIKEENFFLYGADEGGEIALKDCDFASKVALMIGQEGEGLRNISKKYCDITVRIPMANDDICLNAADSALIMLYELYVR